MKYDMHNSYEWTINYTPHPTKFIEIFQRPVDDQFYQERFSEIKQPNSSKLRTYRIVKTEKPLESYLYELKNLKHRIMMVKFRLSDHKLTIETGIHENAVKELRFYSIYPNKVEDELRLILEYQCY